MKSPTLPGITTARAHVGKMKAGPRIRTGIAVDRVIGTRVSTLMHRGIPIPRRGRHA